MVRREDDSENWGGEREGSGRPKIIKEDKAPLNAMLEQSYHDKLLKIDKKKIVAIRKAIDFYIEKKKL